MQDDAKSEALIRSAIGCCQLPEGTVATYRHNGSMSLMTLA